MSFPVGIVMNCNGLFNKNNGYALKELSEQPDFVWSAIFLKHLLGEFEVIDSKVVEGGV